MKAKEKFEEWCFNNIFSHFNTPFARKHFKQYWEGKYLSEKWGVYLEFFDSEGIIIEVEPEMTSCNIWIWEHDKKENCFEKLYSDKTNNYTRQQAQTEAINKAFEILEERL